MPLAEETGLICAIGRWVLRSACAQAAAWRAAHPAAAIDTIAVNLSARQLGDAGLPQAVADALADAGLPAGCLVLEITETALMHDTGGDARAAARAQGARRAPRRRRLRHRLLVAALPAPLPGRHPQDRPSSFVDGMVGDDGRPRSSRAILDLGANLELDVVAEGIETAEQAALLSALGCAMGQGFHFAAPMDAGAAGAALARR